MPLGIFRKAARPSAFVRNRPVLRSPVMERLDELFADPARNADLYAKVLEDDRRELEADYVLGLFATFAPDGESRTARSDRPADSAAVVEHVFEHILGARSWWGRNGASWNGSRLFAEAYKDAMRRAQANGNCPIRTFHNQHSPDGKLQFQVLDAGTAVVVIVATPAVPDLGPRPPWFKTPPRTIPTRWDPIDPNMPEVSVFNHETVPSRLPGR